MQNTGTALSVDEHVEGSEEGAFAGEAGRNGILIMGSEMGSEVTGKGKLLPAGRTGMWLVSCKCKKSKSKLLLC